MRIISGSLKGRTLSTPPGPDTRPAMARTREALFSMLDSRGIDWNQARVLDLFAGTGSLAFEALSRGAIFASLVDGSQKACQIMRKNAQALEVQDRCAIISQDVLRFLRQAHPIPYNLIFIDPPYRQNMALKTLQALTATSLMSPAALIVAEVETGPPLALPACYSLLVQRQFGQTCIHIWENL